jgi:glycosyltransferase involved in cell wall biosynthesis
VVAASRYLGEEARALGARETAIVPVPLETSSLGAPVQPPHVLFAGRLSEEKGILEFLAATEGIPRVVVGDGPLRDHVADGVGYVQPSELAPYFARATVVCVPSRREGYGMTAREALAHGRPVVATRVGGLADLDGPGVTLVPPRDGAALRSAIESVLASPVLPEPAGLSFAEVGAALRDVYEAAVR